MTRTYFLGFALYLGLAGLAEAQAPLEAYSELPTYRNAVLSPSGEKLAMIMTTEGSEVLCAYEIAPQKLDCFLNVSEIKPNRLLFAGENNVILIAAQQRREHGYRDTYEATAAISVDLKSKKNYQIARRTDGIHPAQSGMGRIVSISPDGSKVYTPGFIGTDADARYSLLEGRTGSEMGKEWTRGSPSTIDWFATPEGKALARVTYYDPSNELRVESFLDDTPESVVSGKDNIGSLMPDALSPDGEHLVFVRSVEGADNNGVFFLNLVTGEIDGPRYHKDGADIDGLLVDENRVAHGVVYSGMTPSYGMFDPALNSEIDGMVSGASMTAVSIASWSDDWSKILFHVSGGGLSGRYLLYDRATKGMAGLFDTRPQITGDKIGEVTTINYKARDGLDIPAIVTWPVGVAADQRKNLPIIVLPHGGPEAYDQVGFDWMAQSFASQGYMVLQPNFRGSAGFGSEFALAGRGEWGKAMQDDVTDGLDALVSMGWADPERACIVGWSYGGYAALAGGAFTPDKYKCVVSIAGVSDLPIMLFEEEKNERDGRQGHWVYDYWIDQIGDVEANREEIRQISPHRYADQFKAPVLLIHGDIDDVVRDQQSRIMEDALKKAGKSVKLVILRGQDHSLSTKNARVTAMTEIMTFVNEAIGGR